MDPSRKRTIRLVVALSAAVLLASARIYTSFTASDPRRAAPASSSRARLPGKSYELSGKVADGSWVKRGAVNLFRVRDRDGHESVPLTYVGTTPDPFREGREIVVTVRQATATVDRREGLPGHQVPVEVHRPKPRRPEREVLIAGKFLLVLRSSSRSTASAPRWSASGRTAGLLVDPAAARSTGWR